MTAPPSIGVDMLISDLFGADRQAIQYTTPLLVFGAQDNPELLDLKHIAETRFATLQVVDGAWHANFVDLPEEFIDRCCSFFQRLSRSHHTYKDL